MNCWLLPRATDTLEGVTAIETSCAAVTVSVAEADFPDALSVAVMVVVPGATELASPFDPVAFETVATLAFDEDQVTAAVRSWVVESV